MARSGKNGGLILPVAAVVIFAALLAGWSEIAGFLGLAAGGRAHSLLRDAVAVALWFSSAWAFNRLIGAILWRGVVDSAGRAHAPRILVDLIAGIVYAVAIVTLAAIWFEYEIASSAIATSGILVAVVGFALRDTIADIFSGITTHFERPYAIGDWLELQPGRVGEVVEISWRTTRLVTQDQLSLVVPNGLLSRVQYTNYSAPDRHFRDAVRLRISPAVSPERAKQVIMNALSGLQGVLKSPAPEVRAIDIERFAVIYEARFWVPDYPVLTPLRDAAITRLIDHLDKAGIPLAADRRDITVTRAERHHLRHLRPLDLLRRIELFDVLDDDDALRLSEAFRERRVTQRTTIVREGEAGSSLFILAEGLVGVERIQPETGQSVQLAQLEPGSVFGEMSLLTGQVRSATIRALTDALLYEVDGGALAPILQRRPELTQLLSAKVARRIGRNEVAATERSDMPAASQDETRLASQILARLRSFFGLGG